MGIGANTAIFQLLNAVRLRSLPVQAPEQLAEIRIADMRGVRGDFSIWHAGATNAIWQQIRDRQEAFSGVFAWSSTGIGLPSAHGEPRFASALLVSGEFFNVLGVRPLLGRFLTPQDDQRNCSAPGVVLSHAFWQKEFGGDPSVLGRKTTLARYPFEIIGVAPQSFTGLEVGRRFDVAVPLCAEWLPPGSENRLDSGMDWWLIVMGRLKAGWTVERASAHLASISPAVFDASLPWNYPADDVQRYRAFRLKAEPASGGISLVGEQYSGSLWFLQATAGLVLLIGCANLANLMLARAAAREREISVRVALGAGRGRLIRLLLTESLLLSIAGASAGIWLADGLSKFLVDSINVESNSLFLDLGLDWRLLGFSSLTGIVTCALVGLAPALGAARVAPDAILRAGGRSSTDPGGRRRLRQMLVVSQLALSFVLLAAALLFGRTLKNLMVQDLGMHIDGVTISYVDMSRLNLPLERRAVFKRTLMRQLEQTPGVISVAETSLVPLSGGASDNSVWVDETDATQRGVSFFMNTSAGYFKTMATPLLAGRSFDDDRDTPQSPLVAMVNEAFARKFFAGNSPLGKRFWREARADAPVTAYEIVGLVKDAKYRHLRQEFMPTAYLSISQDPRPGTFAQLLIRTSMAATVAVSSLRAVFRNASPEIVPTFQDFRSMIDGSLMRDRLVTALSGFFGLLAVSLATIGIYGLVSFGIAQRTREIGVRIALGAEQAAILKMIVREAVALVCAGLLAGCLLVLALGRSVGALVYGLEPGDPVTLLAAALLLAAAALGASVVPARRAARLDPMAALRFEYGPRSRHPEVQLYGDLFTTD